MMVINGEKLNIKQMKLDDYLVENNYNSDYVVVELNGEIIDKTDYKNIVLQKGDTVEILMFMGGG